MIVTRFAPSPTGHLHLGHAYSARVAWLAARAAGGRFLVRIEDIDPTRCRREFEDSILADLEWLGLDRDGAIRRQADHLEDYAGALARLDEAGLIYPCFCTRKEIRREIAAIGNAPHGPAGPRYPGTCRRLTAAERTERVDRGDPYALRLDTAKAAAGAGALTWHDREAGTIAADPLRLGDVVIARKDTPTSYHLAVTVDDAIQGITLVTRGRDLFESTHVHRLLQALLDLPTPDYAHHPLVTSPDGKRLAKRDRTVTIKSLRESDMKAETVWDMIGAYMD